ncbi:MAG: enoyl-CoA hydratase/isomerase family protein [Acidimicrobiia bacterium]
MDEAEFLDALRSPYAADALGHPLGGAVVVELATTDSIPDSTALGDAMASLPCVVVGVGGSQSAIGDLCDVVLEPGEPALDAVLETVHSHPHTATSLAILLRGSLGRTLGDGLAAESSVYSALQGGPEFATWRAATPVRARPDDTQPAVRTERIGERLLVTLSRPDVHNAFDARMRDELLDALAIAANDPSIAEVVLAGDGPSFCSGGDLDEFGTRPDPATAHLVRLARNAGRALAAMADRVTARIHGSCLGSGIELPAFASRVVAHADTVIALPEVGMGLIPGAGGTVSLPRRIGRHRTARLALSQRPIDALTALAWGLVDEIEP